MLSSAFGAGIGALYSPARASCTSYAPSTGTTVTCSGSSTTAVTAATGSTTQAFAYHQAGGVVGGDGEIAEGLRIGASIGTSFGQEEVAGQASESTSQGLIAMLHGTLRRTGAFVSASLGAGYQAFALSRRASVAGTLLTAEADTEGFQLGGKLETGADIPLRGGWMLTPRVSAAYLHQQVEGYEESGGEAAAVALEDHGADALRLRAELAISQKKATDFVVYVPHLKAGVVQDIQGGGMAEGYFIDARKEFELPLADVEAFRIFGGVGLQASFANGSSLYVSYEGEAGQDRTTHALMGGVRAQW